MHEPAEANTTRLLTYSDSNRMKLVASRGHVAQGNRAFPSMRVFVSSATEYNFADIAHEDVVDEHD